MENEVEEQRTKEQIVDSIVYNKRVIRGLEIIFVIFALGVLGFFVKMMVYGGTALDIISYTILLIGCWRLWDTGQGYEVSKLWDEVELLNLIEKEKDEEIS